MDKFREPDISAMEGGYAIWYGPAGPEGDCATEVEASSYGWEVTEYQDLHGLVDDIASYGDETILAISTLVEEAADAREAACKGVRQIAHYGGDESYVASLPL